jgi:hypothetical protein
MSEDFTGSIPDGALLAQCQLEQRSCKMAERMTKERANSALEHYLRACKSAGMTDEQLDGACIAAPYGQILYVCRYGMRSNGYKGYEHDLPGFNGSGGSGAINLREIHTKLLIAANTLYELRISLRDAVEAVR